MSEQTALLKQSRASKIQIEVKEIVPPTSRKTSLASLNTDADGSDASN